MLVNLGKIPCLREKAREESLDISTVQLLIERGKPGRTKLEEGCNDSIAGLTEGGASALLDGDKKLLVEGTLLIHMQLCYQIVNYLINMLC